ncbi:unnamed protein product [Linum tenue]|uniref:Uncharacterized protein n=1 Tax=Linum tenue TaxID=586396 RepID=A0AAV0L6R4_9ROSI|nr:unnamed protein product [Linum tenue]
MTRYWMKSNQTGRPSARREKMVSTLPSNPNAIRIPSSIRITLVFQFPC